MRESQRKLELQGSNEKFLTVPLSELNKNLPGTQPIFYVGTDNECHYFVFYYDKMIKTSMGYRIPKSEFFPKELIKFQNSNYSLKKFPYY